MDSPRPPNYTQANQERSNVVIGTAPISSAATDDQQASPNAAALSSAAEHLVAGLRALVDGPRALPKGPLIVEHRERRIALGRTRMQRMSGRNAALYIKSKVGATESVVIEAAFRRDEDGALEWAKVDLDAWEELVPYMQRLIVHE
ncbi:hypothetical protein HDZ31DRAFT_45641 [Schizophyllum fasciatum]